MRRASGLRIGFMFLITAVLGGLAGYGALRLWREQVSPAAAPAVLQAAAGPAVPSPAPASGMPAAATSPAKTSPPSANRRAPGESGNRQPVPRVNFSSDGAEHEEAEPAPADPLPARQPATPPRPPATSSADATLRPHYSIDLDLTRARQQQALDVDDKPLVVVGLQKCPEKYELQPDAIVIKAARDVTIAVSYGSLSGGKTQVTLEATIKNDAGKSLPFTVRNMENIRRQLGQQGEQAAAQVVAWKAERQALEAELRATGIVVNPAQYNAARRRVEELKQMIPEADKRVAAMKADFDAAETMAALAKSLHETCVVLFEAKR